MFRAELSGSFDTGGFEHRVIVGMDSDKFENDQFALRDRSTPQLINVFDPVYGAYPLPPLDPVNTPNIDRLETQESMGLYIQDQISVTDKLDIRVGARFDDYKQELKNRRSNSSSKYSETQVSPQFGVVYHVSDALAFYAVYGENFRPLSGATDENDLDPNESKSTEVGINFTLNDGALEGTLAIFDIEQTNISTVDADFLATAIGEAESQGIELDLRGNITDTLSIWVSYTFIDAKTKNAFNDPDFGRVVPAEADLLNIPEQQLSLQLVQQTQLAGKALQLIGGLVYVDDRNGFFSDQDFRLPSYTTVQIAANYDVSKSLSLRAEINNLFDEEYYTNSYADVWVQSGTPFNARLSATFRY